LINPTGGYPRGSVNRIAWKWSGVGGAWDSVGIIHFITGNLVMGGDDVHLREPYCLSYLGWSVFNLFLCDLLRGTSTGSLEESDVEALLSRVCRAV